MSGLKLRPRALPLALLALVWCAGGCGRRETPVEAGNRAQILHRGIGNEVTELDPHLVTGVAEGNVLRALFEGLVTEHPEDLRPVPGVAERWDISPDALVYTFHLRADAQWSNGDPVTAGGVTVTFAGATDISAAPLFFAENVQQLDVPLLATLAGGAALLDTTLTATLDDSTATVNLTLGALSSPVTVTGVGPVNWTSLAPNVAALIGTLNVTSIDETPPSVNPVGSWATIRSGSRSISNVPE